MLDVPWDKEAGKHEAATYVFNDVTVPNFVDHPPDEDYEKVHWLAN